MAWRLLEVIYSGLAWNWVPGKIHRPETLWVVNTSQVWTCKFSVKIHCSKYVRSFLQFYFSPTYQMHHHLITFFFFLACWTTTISISDTHCKRPTKSLQESYHLADTIMWYKHVLNTTEWWEKCPLHLSPSQLVCWSLTYIKKMTVSSLMQYKNLRC